MFAITPTPWKQRHGNSDREQLLLYMCAISPINYMYMYAPWHVLAWISVLLISHRCLGTVQYLCFCKLYSLICTMVAVAFDHIFFPKKFLREKYVVKSYCDHGTNLKLTILARFSIFSIQLRFIVLVLYIVYYS